MCTKAVYGKILNRANYNGKLTVSTFCHSWHVIDAVSHCLSSKSALPVWMLFASIYLRHMIVARKGNNTRVHP